MVDPVEEEEPKVILTKEEKMLATGQFVRHACNNVIPVEDIYCRFCKKFNAATSAQSCPTCGKDFAEA